MNKRMLQQLDYYRIRDSIAELCVSEEGKEELLKREPVTDEKEGEDLRNLSRDWTKAIHSTHPKILHGWTNVSRLFHIIKVEGTALTVSQAYALEQFCLSAIAIKQDAVLASQEVKIPNLLALTENIPELKDSEKEISRIIDKDGQIKDLPELRAIRNKINSLRHEIEVEIKKYTTDSRYASVLQSTVPVLRNEHQVLAVRSDRRGSIHGIIHEMSQSGQTVYIEPDEAVKKSNDLVQEQFHLQQEIHRILQELTTKLKEYLPLYKQALPVMVRLDATYASARWADVCKGIFADTCKENEAALLLQARHPLLGDKAVPIDVQFLDDKRVLIITGPNTGGKTVTLKTIALFSLLNQSGFPIPAKEGTRLPVFDSVYADIGDEQSLDESLSTFSGHMKNIALALKKANEHSLVLLDELGSGTDPQEGGAIAMAILDTLIEKKAFVLVTTHHGILKNYGYTHPACINASVDFDENTLAPTYHILMGVPGESHALDIARRSGLPHFVTEKAKSYLTNEQADVSSLIKGLNAKHEEMARLQKSFKEKEQYLNEKIRKTDLRDLRQRQKELELKQREQKEMNSFLSETRKKLENLVRELREGEITREKNLSVKAFISSLTDDVEDNELSLLAEEEKLIEDQKNLNKKIEAEEAERKRTEIISENGMRISSGKGKHSSNKQKKKKLSNTEALALIPSPDTSVNENISLSAKEVKISVLPPQPKWEDGAEVFVGTAKRRGTLVHKEKNGVWSVQFGGIRMSIKEKNMTLVPIGEQKTSIAKPSIILETVDGETDKGKPAFELRLLGMRYEDAIKALERQLDLCAITNFKSFSIIHGKGSGILQQGVQQYLSQYPGIKEFHFAQPEDGGTGKTYVTLI